MKRGIGKVIKSTKLVGDTTALQVDPDILEGIKDDVAATRNMDTASDVDEVMEEALDINDAPTGFRRHPIGNGTTVPMPYEGEDTTDVATCSKPVREINRGCMHYGVRCRLPMLAKKYGETGGPYNLRYKELRSGVVKTCFCARMASTYLNLPNIVLIPPGKDDPEGQTWYPTLRAERTPLPNGQMPVQGPGQPTTPIKLTPQKTYMPCVPSAAMTREYQLMRRRGDFDKPMRPARPRR